MSENGSPDMKQVLEEIRTNQQVMLVTTRKHLELYAQQLANTDLLNKQMLELQQKTFQVQKITMGITLLAVLALGVFLIARLV